MTDQAQIIVHEHELYPGVRTRTYAWQGLSGWPVFISGDALRGLLNRPVRNRNGFPESLDCFPWHLRLVDDSVHDCYIRNGAYYARTDAGMWAYLRLCVRASRFYQHLKMRLILTLMVWNLAYIEQGEQISWRCVGRKNPYR